MNEVIIDDMIVRIDTDRKTKHEIVREFVGAANEQVSHFCYSFRLYHYLKPFPHSNAI